MKTTLLTLAIAFTLMVGCKKEKNEPAVVTHNMEILITIGNTPGYYTINNGPHQTIGYTNSSPQLITFNAKVGDQIYASIYTGNYGGANYDLYLKQDGIIVFNKHYYYTDYYGIINYTVKIIKKDFYLIIPFNLINLAFLSSNP